MRMRQLMATALFLSLGCGGALAGELTVYTALEADQLKAYKDAFEAKNPGTTINWVRDSTGVVTAKLLAEKAAPVADVVMGLAATSLMQFCGMSNADALQYWERATDGQAKGYERVRASVAAFRPDPSLEIPEAVQRSICPDVPLLASSRR